MILEEALEDAAEGGLAASKSAILLFEFSESLSCIMEGGLSASESLLFSALSSSTRELKGLVLGGGCG